MAVLIGVAILLTANVILSACGSGPTVDSRTRVPARTEVPVSTSPLPGTIVNNPVAGRDDVRALSYSQLEARVGWSILRSTNSRFARQSFSRFVDDVGTSGAAIQEMYTDVMTGASITIVQRPSNESPGDAAARTPVSTFDVTVMTEDRQTEAAFDTGSSWNGIPVFASVTGPDPGIVLAFVRTLTFGGSH
jgi:hypothetical protein